jgi:hypothetical protein
MSTHSSISLFLTSVSFAGLSIHDNSNLAAVDLAQLFKSFFVHFTAVHNTGLIAHSQAHIAKSEPLGNSDSEIISYNAISQAHSIAHAAALYPKGACLIASIATFHNGVALIAFLANHSAVATCAISQTSLLHL